MSFSFHNITCRRGDKTLFAKLGYTALPGSFTLVRGRNGSGKTSLLQLAATILRAEQGELLWEGEGVQDSHSYREAMLYIGHQNAIKPELTVLQNLRFYADLSDSLLLLPAALHYWGLEPLMDVPCAELSAGWRRRVALARLIVVPALVWLLDEPEVHLDEDGVRLLWQLIASRCNQKGIVFMASHAESKMKPCVSLELEDFISVAEENG